MRALEVVEAEAGTEVLVFAGSWEDGAGNTGNPEDETPRNAGNPTPNWIGANPNWNGVTGPGDAPPARVTAVGGGSRGGLESTEAIAGATAGDIDGKGLTDAPPRAWKAVGATGAETVSLAWRGTTGTRRPPNTGGD